MTNTDEPLWDRMPPAVRKRSVWTLWFVTWAGLLAGLYDRVFYEYVVYFTAVHALLVLFVVGFRFAAFPAQIRLIYLVWVVVGTYAPHMVVLMYISTVGLATNLFAGYCPMARMVYLLPWNREDPFSFKLIAEVFFSPPVSGKFKPRATAA